MGLIRSKTQSPAGAPYDAALFGMDRAGSGALSGRIFLGIVVPWRCHGLRVRCPSRGVRFCAGPHRFSQQCGTIRSRDSLRKSSRKMTEVVSLKTSGASLSKIGPARLARLAFLYHLSKKAGVFTSRRDRLLSAHGNAMGLIRSKPKALPGAP